MQKLTQVINVRAFNKRPFTKKKTLITAGRWFHVISTPLLPLDVILWRDPWSIVSSVNNLPRLRRHCIAWFILLSMIFHNDNDWGGISSKIHKTQNTFSGRSRLLWLSWSSILCHRILLLLVFLLKPWFDFLCFLHQSCNLEKEHFQEVHT